MGRRRKLDVGAVLEGAPIDLPGLVTLIHRVNPTGRRLSAREEERRYVQKAALQSLLLRRYPDHVELVADDGREDLYVLRTRPDGRDAGHVVLEQLDEDLLPALRSRLAATEDDGRTDAPQHAPAGHADVLEEARELRESWDLPGAADAYARVARTGHVGAGREALELRIEMLGEQVRAALEADSAP